MQHRGAAILEISHHVTSESAEYSEQEIRTSNLIGVLRFHGIFHAFPKTVDSGIAKLYGQSNLIVNYCTKSDLSEASSIESVLM